MEAAGGEGQQGGDAGVGQPGVEEAGLGGQGGQGACAGEGGILPGGQGLGGKCGRGAGQGGSRNAGKAGPPAALPTAQVEGERVNGERLPVGCDRRGARRPPASSSVGGGQASSGGHRAISPASSRASRHSRNGAGGTCGRLRRYSSVRRGMSRRGSRRFCLRNCWDCWPNILLKAREKPSGVSNWKSRATSRTRRPLSSRSRAACDRRRRMRYS